MQIVHGTLDDGVLIFPDRAVQVHVQSERVRAGDDRLAQLPPSERAGQGDILPSRRRVEPIPLPARRRREPGGGGW